MKYFLALLGVLLAAAPAAAQGFDCAGGFTSTAGTCSVSGNSNQGVNGEFWSDPLGNEVVQFSGSSVDIMPANQSHRVAALNYQTPVGVQAFTVSFTFIPNGNFLSFVLNNTTNVPGYQKQVFEQGAGGEAGFFQGYSQPAPANNVFALEFDSYDGMTPNTNSPDNFTYSNVQIYQSNLPHSVYPNIYVQCPGIGGSNICGTNTSPSDGNFQLPKISTSPVPLNSPATQFATTTGHTYRANISYDGSNFKLALQDITANSPMFVHTWSNVDIPHSVGGNTAYVGLNASTGSAFIPTVPLIIKGFTFTSSAQVLPTPTPTPTPSPTPTPTPTVAPTPVPYSFVSPAQDSTVSGIITVQVIDPPAGTTYEKYLIPTLPGPTCPKNFGTYDPVAGSCAIQTGRTFTYNTTYIPNGPWSITAQPNGNAAQGIGVFFTVQNAPTPTPSPSPTPVVPSCPSGYTIMASTCSCAAD